jgi:hypothetical protein
VALVFAGGALLASQFIPGVQLWRYWPLIIIAFGVRAMFGPPGGPWSIRHLAEGLSTIALGLVFLGQMIGYLPWNVWLNILRLWPLLLVSLGLEIIGKGLRSEFVRALGAVVIIAGLAYGALVMSPTAGWPVSLLPVASQSEPFDFAARNDAGADSGVASIDGGVGRLAVTAGDVLATAKGTSPFEPVFDVTADGERVDLRIGLGSGSWGPGETDGSLDVTLDRGVAWDLGIDAGVTRYEVDLRELMIRALRLNAGVSDGTLTLGRSDAARTAERVPVTIDAGVSSLTIKVPTGDSVRVQIDQGLTGVDVRGEWTSDKDGDTRVYRSAGFRDTGAYWDIEIDAGIGSITVEYY